MNVHPIIARLGAELAEKPRLRLGVWVIVAILLGYFVFALQSERLAAVAADHADTATRLARARSLLAREDWAERVDAARAAERALTDRFWRADNSGLAQAQLRSAVEALLEEEDLNVDRSTIKLGLSHPVDDVPGLWQVQVQLSGTARKGGVLRVLQAIAAHPNKLLEEQLNITRLRNDRRGDTRFDMLVSAYFIIGATDPATAFANPDTRRSSGPEHTRTLAGTHGVPRVRTDADSAGTHGVPPARHTRTWPGHTAFLRPGHTAFFRPRTHADLARTHGVPPARHTRTWPGHTAFLTAHGCGHTAFLRPGQTRTRRGHTAFLRPGHTRT